MFIRQLAAMRLIGEVTDKYKYEDDFFFHFLLLKITAMFFFCFVF